MRRLHGPLAVAIGVLASRPAGADPTEPNTLTTPLEPAASCRVCHAFPNSADKGTDPSYSPWAWQGSMMANSARDPVFWAGVAIAHQDDPGVTSECVRCHSPRAFLEGRGDAIAMAELMPADLEGVECDLCHRAIDDGVTPPGNAHYAVDDTPVLGAVPKHGPFTYTVEQPQHAWVQDSFTGSSQLCGVCHDVTTPRERVDDAGLPMGRSFNEQRTFSEWANSAFSQPGPDAKTCQDCHMPAVTEVGACAEFDADEARRHPTGARRHELVGANRFMTELLKTLYGSAGSDEVDDVFYDTSLASMDALLATAATMELETPAEVNLGEGLQGLSVTITNNTGHKLPSGYSEGRIMWIEVIASYAGAEVWSSGRYVDGVGPDSDAQLRAYQGVAEDYDDGTQLHLLRNNHWVEDTRIPPKGLIADVETDPVGDRYQPLGDGTWPNLDRATYEFAGRDDVADSTPADPGDDLLELRVRLLYLINTPQYIEFLADENRTNSAGTDVAGWFDDAGGAQPIILAEQSVELPLHGFGSGDGSGTSSGSGSGGTSGSATPGGSQASDPTGTGSSEPSAKGDGCGCTGGRGPGSWGLLALILLAGARRRSASRRASHGGLR